VSEFGNASPRPLTPGASALPVLLALLIAALASAAPATALPSDIDALRAAAQRSAADRAIPAPSAPARAAAERPLLDARRPGPAAAALAGTASRRVASARRSLLRRLGPSGVVRMDAVTGRPRYVARLGGSLTAPSDADPGTVAQRWLAAHAGLYGLDAGELDDLAQTDRYTAPGGLTTIHWHQRVGGLEVVNEELAAAIDADGRLMQVIGPVRADVDGVETEARIDADRAAAIAAADADVSPDGKVDASELVLYGTAEGLRPAWRIGLDADSQHYYEYGIDARDGSILARQNLVAAENAKTFDLWPRADTFGKLGGGKAKIRPLKRLGSGKKDPWRYNTTAPPYNFPFQTLAGNQALLLLDFNDDNGNSANENFFVHPSGGAVNWVFDPQFFNNAPPLRCPPGGRCTWSSQGTPQNWFANAAQDGTQVYWFVNQFHDHLKAPPIGFTERSGNFELINQDGKGGVAGDDVFLQAFDGANLQGGFPNAQHVNNANMLTLADGTSPRMQMYLFTQFPPGQQPLQGVFEVNGGDDASIVYHEYTHGLSNRLVGGPSTQGTLGAQQSSAMGEGWSDFYATDYLVDKGMLPDKPSKPGELVASRYENFTAIRTQAVDCAVGAAKKKCPAFPGGSAGPGGYTFGDYGKVLGEPQVHADGEIWVQTLWDLRAALIKRLGKKQGVKRTELIVTNGLRLTPTLPTYLDARDAILQADAAAKGKGYKKTIWKVFARRGMGSNASTSGPNDNAPKQGFKSPTKK